ncbi:CoA transferase [Allokutzneria sp. A3M-2-11 16]|uniref:CaiB/BaiF CoA transferase family protein n=1 Tax=Allokutzneria sp. A3M-2-11 16 TaxID=2962043 RepID=UPI0020B8CFB8|nr:CaiB/BaiF CoA-transferase family protein [Allokutzneria sp. A3M-2-11 16]MCP3801978.1 CoA transferase [Allokutzneria sp. A3M-2-11 16]
MSQPTSALQGITVVDFTQVYMGPSATQLLGDYGAEVIKIERPRYGDLSRGSITDESGLDNPVFYSINRNKRSVAVDTRTEQGKQVVYDLVRDADVVVSNFRAGVMDRIGFGYDALRRLNPRIIWASGTGFGEVGPYAHKGGQDVLLQAMSGVMWRRQSEELPLSVYPTTLCDYTTGMHLMQGILLALLARERTGEGQRVDVRMFDSMLHMQMQEAATQLNRGTEVNWAAMPLSGVFPTTDGAVCMVGAFKQEPLRDICTALGLPDELWQRPDLRHPPGQMAARAELQEIFRHRFAQHTTEHWVQRLESVDLLCAPVRTMAEALADEQTAVNEMIVKMDHPTEGSVRVLNAPIGLSATPAVVRRRAPQLGEDSTAVLAEHGYDAERIAALRASEVIS